MHPYFRLFGLNIPAYGCMALLGVALGALLALLLNRRNPKLSNADLGYAGLIAGCGALIGAKLLALLVEIPYIAGHFSEIFASAASASAFFISGWVFYGGLIGAIVGARLYCRRYSVDFSAVCDAFAPAVPLFHAVGRVGCFLAGCCYGIEWSGGVVFTESLSAPNGVPLFPVQLLEAGLNLALCLVLIALRRRVKRPGGLFALYLVCYAVIRFFDEFLRGDAIRGVFLLSTSQWISLAIAAAVAVWFFSPRFRRDRA